MFRVRSLARLLRLGGAAALMLAVLWGGGAGCATPSAPERDPYERVNRVMFRFNQSVSRYTLQPIANVWAVLTPQGFRFGLQRFFENLRFPIRFVSHLGQGELKSSGRELLRFSVNVTGGFLGFYDPASNAGLESSGEGLDDMLEKWGVPPGPYWVMPFFGPSNPRDGTGTMLGSALLYPPSWVAPVPGAAAVATSVNTRALDVQPYRWPGPDDYSRVREGVIRAEAEPAEEIAASATPIPLEEPDL